MIPLTNLISWQTYIELLPTHWKISNFLTHETKHPRLKLICISVLFKIKALTDFTFISTLLRKACPWSCPVIDIEAWETKKHHQEQGELQSYVLLSFILHNFHEGTYYIHLYLQCQPALLLLDCPGHLLLLTGGLLHQLALAVEDSLYDHLVPAQDDGVRQDRPEDDTDAAKRPNLESRHLWTLDFEHRDWSLQWLTVTVWSLIDDTIVNVDQK